MKYVEVQSNLLGCDVIVKVAYTASVDVNGSLDIAVVSLMVGGEPITVPRDCLSKLTPIITAKICEKPWIGFAAIPGPPHA